MKQLKTGAKFKITTASGTSGWCDNLIMDSATSLIANGYDVEPVLILGQSIMEVDTTQNGVQAPIMSMELVGTSETAIPQITRADEYSYNITFSREYTFKNTASSHVSVSEVGFDGLNRALFLDSENNPRSWDVGAGDEVIIEMAFVIVLATPKQPKVISILDGDSNPTATIYLEIKPMAIDPTGADWWKLLSGGAAENVKLVTDSDWDGVSQPTSVHDLSEPADYDFSDRNIKVRLKHRGSLSNNTVYGYIVSLGPNVPPIGVKFEEPFYIGNNYLFYTNVNVTW